MREILHRDNIKGFYLYLDFYLTCTNNCFKMYTKFTEIGSDIYEERTHKNTNESKR